MDWIKSIMKEKYNLELTNILPQKGGWAALAFKVCSNERSFFLKVYEKSRASTSKWTALIDHYVPITVWLMNNSGLKNKLPIPLPTKYGDYKSEDDRGIYLLYEYIEGETIGDKDLTAEQVCELASMIAELHMYGDEIPLGTKAIKEDFAVPFLAQMRTTLEQKIDGLPGDVGELLKLHMEPLRGLMDSVEKLCAVMRSWDLRMALCHTDLHHWNLIQSDGHLMLIDWEGLKLAPVEADLMFFIDEPYYAEFIANYRKVHHYFEINPEVLQFYRNRRKLEDIWEFAEQLLFDRQEASERAATINYLSKELNEISG